MSRVHRCVYSARPPSSSFGQCRIITIWYLYFFPLAVLRDELDQLEHVSVEHFKSPPREARHIELRLSREHEIPDGEFVRHLLTHISNRYEGRMIKPSDCLSFEFYARNLSLEVFEIRTFPDAELDEQMQNMKLDGDQFVHISSSTTWSILSDFDKNDIVYPISDVGGLSEVYEKVMNIVQKTKYQSKHYVKY